MKLAAKIDAAQPTLAERIGAVRAEIEAAIDARVEVVAEEAPGVPKEVLRQILTARSGGCLCRAYGQLPAA